MFVGKCLRNEDEDKIRQAISDVAEGHLKKKDKKIDVIDKIIQQLIKSSDSKIESLVTEFEILDRQTLRQILRNINNAKTDAKKQQALGKMKDYLRSGMQ